MGKIRVKTFGLPEEVQEKSREAGSGSARQGKDKFKKVTLRKRSQNYQANVGLIDKAKFYPLSDALKILSEFKKSKFDETVELHVNTNIDSLSTSITLPYGTGKKVRVAVADDKLIESI